VPAAWQERLAALRALPMRLGPEIERKF